MPIRTAIVEDDKIFREELTRLLKRSPGYTCAGAYASGEEALEGVDPKAIDVILMDLQLPGMSGTACIQELRRRWPEVQVMALSVVDNLRDVVKCFVAGALGYLLKEERPTAILQAIRDLHEGGAPMSNKIARHLVQTFHKDPPGKTQEKSLSNREQEVMALMSKGLQYKEIALELNLSIETVRTHVRNSYRKLDARSSMEAIRKLFLGKLTVFL